MWYQAMMNMKMARSPSATSTWRSETVCFVGLPSSPFMINQARREIKRLFPKTRPARAGAPPRTAPPQFSFRAPRFLLAPDVEMDYNNSEIHAKQRAHRNRGSGGSHLEIRRNVGEGRMEKARTQSSANAAGRASRASGGSRPANASGTAKTTRAGGAGSSRRATPSGAAKTARAGGAGSSRRATPSGAAKTARAGGAGSNRRPTRSGASKRRGPQKRRKALRLSPRDVRLWLLAGALIVAIALIVILVCARTGAPQADAVATPAPTAAATEEAAAATPETGSDIESDVGSADAAGALSATTAADGTVITPRMAELIDKFQVLDNLANTAQPLGVPECARVSDSYFDDALFVGDSVTLKLQKYVLYARQHSDPNLLGQARFLAAQSFSARNALMQISDTSIHPVIGGVKMTLEDAIAQLAPKKLYLMLGMNDVGVSGADGALANMGNLLARIKQKNPDLQIFVESATPRLAGSHPTTRQLFGFDLLLYEAILTLNDPSIHFIDVAYAMRDEQGLLIREYCDDPNGMAIHFTNEGCRHWIDFLYTHALV